jgi:hypothetical protein
MNSKRIIHIVFVLSLILVFGFTVTPASANAPIFFEWPDDTYYDVVSDCSFPIVSHIYGTTTNKAWLDENDNPYKVIQQYRWTEIWSANGKALEIKNISPARAWMETDTNGYYVILGVWYKITVPGEGVVVKDVGLWLRKMIRDEEGNYITTDLIKDVGVSTDIDWTPICEYLAP